MDESVSMRVRACVCVCMRVRIFIRGFQRGCPVFLCMRMLSYMYMSSGLVIHVHFLFYQFFFDINRYHWRSFPPLQFLSVYPPVGPMII